MRPMRNDGIEGPIALGSIKYSQNLTQDLVNAIRENPNVEVIYFNDKNITGVTYYKNHDNHLHIRYKSEE